MTRREDERGHIVRIYEPGDGMRRRFYGALEESRFVYPRKVATKHAQRWYCDGHLSSRPISGIWACATLAEHLLAKSRETGHPDIRVAARFFASTRRVMRNVLTHYKVTTRLTRKGVAFAKGAYLRLCDEGIALLTPTSEL